jgi:hypothetical protein
MFSSILINHVQAFVVFEKLYLSYIVSNGDTFYMKVVSLVGIYNFIVSSFFIGGR